MLNSQQLATLLDPSTLIVNMVFAMSWGAFYFAVLAWALPIPRKRAYFALTLSWSAIELFFKPIVPQHVFMCFNFVAIFIFPLIMSKGPLFPRFVVVALANVALIPAELVSVLLFASFTGLGMVDNATLLQLWYVYLPSFALGDFLTFFLVMAAIKRIAHRALFKDGAGGLQPDNRRASGQDGARRAWLWRYAWFLLLQLALASTLFFIALFMEHGNMDRLAPVGLCVMLCASVDVVLFWQI